MGRFRDRAHAGRELAARLSHLSGEPGLLVLALPPGGVPVGAEVARVLEAPLEVLVVRRLPLPGQPGVAMGAIASGRVRVLDARLAGSVPEEEIDRAIAREEQELERRERLYRDGPPPDVRGRTVILVDDGVADGATVWAAAEAMRSAAARKVVVAVPIATRLAVAQISGDVDEVVALDTPEALASVGEGYDALPPVPDDEVRALLRAAADDLSTK